MPPAVASAAARTQSRLPIVPGWRRRVRAPAPLSSGLWPLAGTRGSPECGDVTTSTRAGPRDDSPGRPLTFDLSVMIRRPPAAVFTFLADVQEHEPIPAARAYG